MSNITRRQILLCVAAACGVVGCRDHRSPPSTFSTVRRIVSLAPNTTEAVFEIGAGPLLVGRSRYCDFPPSVRNLPAVGGYVDASFEAIVALRPDLVVGARGPAGAGLVERLEARNSRTYFPATESIAGIEAMITGLASLLERTHEAHRVVQRISDELARIQRKMTGLARPRVLLVFGLSPIVVAGSGSFADEMLALAGATNVVITGPRYPTIGLETVLALDPDMVVDVSVAEGHGRQRIAADLPGWERVGAVRHGRVATLEDEVILRPGPRVAQGVARLAEVVHPGMVVR